MLQVTPGFLTSRPRAVAYWLFVVAAMIVAIVVVGGMTRLTNSGLSITVWKPISGIVPPLNDAAWQAEFAAYRAIPQYRVMNAGMSLESFQQIFFWEYLHRLLGRLIGIAVAAPLAWFAFKRAIPRGYGWRLAALLALIGLQGTLGWLMVRSGLSVRTEVAPLWLAAHLLTALFTLAGVMWTALDLLALDRDPFARPAWVTMIGAIAGGVLATQLFFGALMAGLRAGLVTNEWPLMNGHVFPGEVIGSKSLGSLLVSDPSIVHFIHRWWAWVAVAALIVVARRAKQAGDRSAAIAIQIAIGLQILLGIATVMSGVETGLAALHQLVGALLVAALVWGAHAIGSATENNGETMRYSFTRLESRTPA